MRQRARDAQKILKMLPQQREERRYTNVLGNEWVSRSSNETAKKSSSAPLASLYSSHPSGLAAGLFFYVLCPWLAYSGN